MRHRHPLPAPRLGAVVACMSPRRCQCTGRGSTAGLRRGRLPRNPWFAGLEKTSMQRPQLTWLADLEADPVDALPARTDIAAKVAVVGIGLRVDTEAGTVNQALGLTGHLRGCLRRGRAATAEAADTCPPVTARRPACAAVVRVGLQIGTGPAARGEPRLT